METSRSTRPARARAAGAGAAALLACLLACLALPAVPAAAGGAGAGLSYIRAHQAPDGGFFEPGREGAGQDATTAWCIMALRAAGTDPGTVRKGGRSPVDFLSTQSANWRSVTDFERTLLAAVAGGADPRSFGGVDLVAKVVSFQRPGGNIGDAVNSNAFGIMALRAAGLGVPDGAVAWLKSAQNADGGWGNNPGGASNPDMTGASVMALLSAGVGAGDAAVSSALSYLRSIQGPDGGFSFQTGGSDVSATAWCVQAIAAVGQDPGGAEWSKGGATPRGYLLAMQAGDGHFTWTAGREMNPVWTTAYAVCALEGRPYPVACLTGTGGGAAAESAAAGATAAAAGAEEGESAETAEEAGEAGEGEAAPEGEAERRPADGPAPAESASREGGGGAWIWWLTASLAALAAAGAAAGGWFLLRRRGPLPEM